MIKDKTELRKDGHRTLEGGMNSGRNPVLLSEQECAFASNVTFRGGFPTNRQKFYPLQLTDGGASGGAPGGLATFQNGAFQGAAIYELDDGIEYIMAMVDGTLFQLTVGAGIDVKGVWNDGLSNPAAPQCWFCQPDVYFVIQDRTSTPLIMQGLSTIRRSGANEVPVGTAMAYGQGRLWVAQGRQLVAGDILGGTTSVISFTEQTYLSSAAYFGVPLTSGSIVGMTFVEQGDTATGQGELLLFARNAAFSIQAGVPREAVPNVTPGWQGTPGMQRIALTNLGGTGWRNVVNVNSDVFFRSKDGWRTFRTARNQQYGWGSAPISNEMSRIMQPDSLALLDYASSTVFKNRIFLTTQPTAYKSNGSASFGQLVILDLEIISSVINKSELSYEVTAYTSHRGSPAYDGVWMMPNGLRILQILSGTFAQVERCFIFAYNPTSLKTEIWELLDEQAFDNTTMPVVCQIETKAFDCKLPDALKELRRGELYFTSLLATIKVTVEWRSDGYPAWTLWSTMTLVGHQSPCTLDNAACQAPGCPTEGYWFKKTIPTPPAVCDPNTSKLLRNGFYFQFRITWEGPATLLMFIMHANELIEDPNGSCP